MTTNNAETPLAGAELPTEPGRIYPCAKCGKLRSKDEGGTTFTVCDSCWDAHWLKATPPTPPDAAEKNYAELLTEFNADYDADLKRLKSILGESWQAGTKWVDAVEARVKELEAGIRRSAPMSFNEWNELVVAREAAILRAESAEARVQELEEAAETRENYIASLNARHQLEMKEIEAERDALKAEVERLRRAFSEQAEVEQRQHDIRNQRLQKYMAENERLRRELGEASNES